MAVGASVSITAPAGATVLEVGDDGAVRTRTDGPTVTWQTAEEKAAAEAKAVQTATATIAPAPQAIGLPPAPQPVGAPVQPVVDARAKLPPAHADSVLAAAAKYGLSPLLIDAVARQESGYRANIVSRAGAVGIMQLMPDTARLMGVKDARDPRANIEGGARYLRKMLDRFGGDVALALAAYNAGPRTVERAGGVPRIRETQNYVGRILANLTAGAAVAVTAAQAAAQIASISGE